MAFITFMRDELPEKKEEYKWSNAAYQAAEIIAQALLDKGFAESALFFSLSRIPEELHSFMPVVFIGQKSLPIPKELQELKRSDGRNPIIYLGPYSITQGATLHNDKQEFILGSMKYNGWVREDGPVYRIISPQSAEYVPVENRSYNKLAKLVKTN